MGHGMGFKPGWNSIRFGARPSWSPSASNDEREKGCGVIGVRVSDEMLCRLRRGRSTDS
jgi:hypothetical protein